METNPSKATLGRMGAWFVAALVGAVLLSGCLRGAGGGDGNEAPEAVLTVDRTRADTDETLTFDATASKDPDGTISLYRFDFGDGTTVEVREPQQPKVTHAYARGGEYAATLMVVDDGANQSGALSGTDNVRVGIDEHRGIPPQVLFAGLANTTSGKYAQNFTTYNGADWFVLDLTFQSVLVAGSSQVTVRVLDPAGVERDSETLTVESGANATRTLDGPLGPAQGDYMIEVSCTSGGVRFTGELVVEYGRGL